jgi:hypothetical protein
MQKLLFIIVQRTFKRLKIRLHSAYADKLQRSCYLPAPDRNCMTHRQALTETAVKINHTIVQQRKSFPSASLYTTNPTWTEQGANQGL